MLPNWELLATPLEITYFILLRGCSKVIGNGNMFSAEEFYYDELQIFLEGPQQILETVYGEAFYLR